MAKELTRFWQLLIARCKTKLISEAQVAQAIGVSPQTFSSWKNRGQFRLDLLSRLREPDILAWRISPQAAVKAGVELIVGRPRAHSDGAASIDAVLRAMAISYRRIEQILHRYASQTTDLFNALEEHSFFAFSSCTSSPYEFEDRPECQTLKTTLAAAIARGVQCLYIRPTEEGLKYFVQDWCYGRVKTHPEALAEFERFRQFVIDELSAGKHPISWDHHGEQGIDALVDERLAQCFVDRSPMWMPGVGLGMLGWKREDALMTRMTISLPGRKFGGVLAYPPYDTLEYRFRRFVRKTVLDARQSLMTKGSRPSDKRPNGLELKVASGSVSHSRRFYVRYSELIQDVVSDLGVESPPRSASRN